MHIDSHPDIVYSACFNWDGSKLVTTCKDKKIRILNPRTGEIESEAMCHDGTKATRAIFLRHGLIFTTGFNRSSERQYSLRAPDALSEPIVMVELDTSNGVMFPLYDPDTNLVFLCGKGDSVIRYFEVCLSEFHLLFCYKCYNQFNYNFRSHQNHHSCIILTHFKLQTHSVVLV